MSGEDVPAAVAAIAALDDPTRRALYRYVAAQTAPVGREEAAAALGVPHHVARFHLDRLHQAGLLEVEFKRPSGRRGPGAGHPTKLYRAATEEFAVSVPERRYDIAGMVLARTVAAAIEDGEPVGEALEEAAGQTGRAIAAQGRPGRAGTDPQPAALAAAVDALDACGFAPRSEGNGYVLGNCPFRALAQSQPDVACRMNLALVRGLLEQLGASAAAARWDPAEGRCCVTIGT